MHIPAEAITLHPAIVANLFKLISKEKEVASRYTEAIGNRPLRETTRFELDTARAELIGYLDGSLGAYLLVNGK